MKILQLHVGLSLMGGAESVIIGLSNELSLTEDVRVCSIFKPIRGGIYYTRLSERVQKENLGIEKNGFSLKNIWKVFKFLKNSDAEIVHFHGFFYYYALPIIFFHRRMKFVYTFHSDAFMENSKWDRRILWLKKFCMKRFWMFPVTISSESKESFRKLYGLDSRLIKNGIVRPKVLEKNNDVDFARITKETKVFFHPGRISLPKNQVVLCKVFQRLIKDGEDVVLLIAGTKQERKIFNELESMFCDRIRYLGERDDVPQLLSRSDGFCLPSIWEGLPITLLESLSVGCIPICSPVGGIVGVIQNGYNGFLSKSSSEDDYYHCMKKYLALSKEDLLSIKEHCRQSFDPYEISNMAGSYLRYYQELLSGKSFSSKSN